MIIPHIRKGIHRIHLLLGQRLGRWILDHKGTASIGFIQALSGKRIRVAILRIKAFRIAALVRLNFVIVRQFNGIIDHRRILCLKNGAVNKGNVFHCNPAV